MVDNKVVDNKSFTSTPDTEVGYGQLLVILLRRRTWFLAIFGGVLVIAALMTLREKPRYQSSMQLLVEPNYEQRLGEEGTTPYASQEDYATQLKLMGSVQFIEKAVESLRSEYPKLDVATLQRSLSLSQLEETKIFQADYIDDDPIKTQKVLETLQQIYLDYNLTQQEQRLRRGLASINEKLQVVRQDLSESQMALKQFRQQQNLIDPEQQAEAVTTSLNNVIQEQQALQTQYQEAQSRYATLQQQLALSPQTVLVAARLSQSSRYQALLNQLQQTEIALAQRRATFTDQDPGVEDLVEQRQNQLALLQQEIERIFGTLPQQLNLSGEELLKVGQLSPSDLELVSALAEAQVTLNGLQARRQSLLETERQLRTELNRFPDLMAEYDRLKPEVDIERMVLEQLLKQQQEVSAELAKGGFNWQVVEPPIQGWQISPNPKQNMLLGAVIGLFLGGVAAFLREAMDTVIRDPESLKKQSDLPLLGSLPIFHLQSTSFLPFLKLRHAAAAVLPLVQMVQQPSFRESLDLIYKNIQIFGHTKRVKSLMITSAQTGEGKSTLALGLAISAARLHQRVLLIDADLRHPSLHSELGLTNTHGLSLLLENLEVRPNPICLRLADVQVDVLPAGLPAVDPVRLLSSPRMKELIHLFESTYDLVILDTSPVLGMVDAIQVASVCSGIILVGRLNQVTESAFQSMVSMLYSLNLVGIVANASHTHFSGDNVPSPKPLELSFHNPHLLRN